MAALLGGIVGAIIIVFLIGLLLGIFAWKSQPPAARALRITVSAYFFCSIMYGFGAADGGSFNPLGFVYYFVGAAAFYVYYRRHLEKHWRDDEDIAADTFS